MKQRLEVPWGVRQTERAALQKEEQTVYLYLMLFFKRILGEYHSIGPFSVFNLQMLLAVSAPGF